MQTRVNTICLGARQTASVVRFVIADFVMDMHVGRIVLPYPFRWNNVTQLYEWERPADSPLAGRVIGALRCSVRRLSCRVCVAEVTTAAFTCGSGSLHEVRV